MTVSALLLLLAAPVLAQGGPAPVEEITDIATLTARARDLRDAVADPRTSDAAAKERARGFFEGLPKDALVVPAYYRRVDRAVVSGKIGTVEGMQRSAEERVSWWKVNRYTAVPDRVLLAVDRGHRMVEEKGIAFESLLDPTQMGLFRYNTEKLDGGKVQLNEKLKMFCALIGDQFCYATSIHELTHVTDREAGLLTPATWKQGEVRAFHAQYDWMKLVDENGERLVTKHRELELWRDREKNAEMKQLLADAVKYLEHLSEVVETNGQERELKDLVERLYKGADGHDHGGGPRS